MNFLADDELSREGTRDEDAIVIINEDVDWDYSFGKENTTKKDLTTAMLRGIAMSLGFGSTVCNNSTKGILFNQRTFFSPFDNLIINSDNVHLNEIPNNGCASPELVSYVTGNNVYYQMPNAIDRKLYAPTVYEDFNSLNYFDTQGDLMSYEIRAGDKNQRIDEKTLEVLRAIGWKIVENDLRIVTDDVDETGMASVSQNYNFHAETTSGNITNYSWKYELQNKDRSYVTIKTGNSSAFTIDEVDDITKYDKNVNGDIKGKITLNATINAKNVTKEFNLYFAVKPSFVSVKIDAITPIPGTKYYNLDLTVMYNGADYLYVEQSEEVSDIVDTYFVYEPYIAHLHFKNIYMIGMA